MLTEIDCTIENLVGGLRMNTLRIFLTVVFGWSFLKTTSLLIRPDSMDLIILSKAGLSWCFWLVIPAIALGQAVALVYLWMPSRTLYRIAQSSVCLDVAETIFASGIAAANPSIAKEAFVTSRISRGLPVRDEILQMMDNPVAQMWPVCFTLGFGLLWLYLLYRFNTIPNN
jgi:hypothetical protein